MLLRILKKKTFPRNWNNFINFNVFNLTWMFSDNLSMSVFAKNLFQGKQQQNTIPFSKKKTFLSFSACINLCYIMLHQFHLIFEQIIIYQLISFHKVVSVVILSIRIFVISMLNAKKIYFPLCLRCHRLRIFFVSKWLSIRIAQP